jgi:hypothetical protein
MLKFRLEQLLTSLQNPNTFISLSVPSLIYPSVRLDRLAWFGLPSSPWRTRSPPSSRSLRNPKPHPLGRSRSECGGPAAEHGRHASMCSFVDTEQTEGESLGTYPVMRRVRAVMRRCSHPVISSESRANDRTCFLLGQQRESFENDHCDRWLTKHNLVTGSSAAYKYARGVVSPLPPNAGRPPLSLSCFASQSYGWQTISFGHACGTSLTSIDPPTGLDVFSSAVIL